MAEVVASSPLESHALIILFDGYNTLDVNGPYESLRMSGTSQIFKKITVATESEHPVKSTEGALMIGNITFDKALETLDKYDLLVVPGGATTSVQAEAKRSGSSFMKIISTFYNLKATSPDRPPRFLLSICTGALFLSKLGIFNNKYCTTHHGIYDLVQSSNKTAAAQANPPAKAGIVLPARYVDNGEQENGRIRVISSGGISCAIDAALHIVGLRAQGNVPGRDLATAEISKTCEMLDYAFRYTDGVTFGESFD